jgi:two-component system, NarL family, nitrate/nitrite response regulator NarL
MTEGTHEIRIAIADDHQIFRDGLKRLLESEPGFKVVAEAADGVEAIRVTRQTSPDVLLLDVAMPRMGGIDVISIPDLQATRVIFLTAAIEPSELLRAVQHGARGVVLKESATRTLIDGIYRVMEGKLLIGSEIADDLAHAVRQSGSQRERPFGLTPREIEIVEAVTAGDSNRDIAVRLDISLQTVKHHLTKVFDKTGTSSRLELALFALRHGIVETH